MLTTLILESPSVSANALTTQRFLQQGQALQRPVAAEHLRVVQKGFDKKDLLAA